MNTNHKKRQRFYRVAMLLFSVSLTALLLAVPLVSLANGHGNEGALETSPGMQVNIINHSVSLFLSIIAVLVAVTLLVRAKRRSTVLKLLVLGLAGFAAHDILDFVFHVTQKNIGTVPQEVANIFVHWGGYIVLILAAFAAYKASKLREAKKESE